MAHTVRSGEDVESPARAWPGTMLCASRIGDEDRLLGESQSPFPSLMAGRNDVLAHPYPTLNASSFRDSRSRIAEQIAASEFH